MHTVQNRGENGKRKIKTKVEAHLVHYEKMFIALKVEVEFGME
jgi:hypothetical protein